MSRILNLEIANTAVQTVPVNNSINLGRVVRKYCCNVNGTPTFTYLNDSNSVGLNQPGYYVVTVNLVFTGAVGDATYSLYSNGVKIPHASSSVTIGTADTQSENMSITTVVRVLPTAPITLSVVNEGVETDLTLANLTIIKIC